MDGFCQLFETKRAFSQIQNGVIPKFELKLISSKQEDNTQLIDIIFKRTLQDANTFLVRNFTLKLNFYFRRSKITF